MGNQNTSDGKQTPITTSSNKIILKLRNRDIILHYSFKFKVNIGDIDIFPSGFDGLRLWDTDVILSRFIILQNERFQNKSVCVFKAGVGLSGIALSKWSTCKSITMIDFKQEVVRNMKVNCEKNQVKNVESVLIDLNQFDNFSKTYDVVVSANLFGQGFSGQNVLNIWRKLLNVGGQAYLLVPDRKTDVKKFVQFVDKTEFKINNLILTAEEYQASPLFNKIEGQTQFPKIGKSDFYVIGLTKLREGMIVQKPLPQGHGLKEETQKVRQNGNVHRKVQKQEEKTPGKVVQHKIVDKQDKKEEKAAMETKIEEKEQISQVKEMEQQKPKQIPTEEKQKEQVIEEKKEEEQKQQEKPKEQEKQTIVEVKEQENKAEQEDPIKQVEKCENIEQQSPSQVEDEKCQQKQKNVETESIQKQEEKTQKQIEKQQQPKQQESENEQKKQKLADEQISEKDKKQERKLSEEQVVKGQPKQQHNIELPLTHEPVKNQQQEEQKEEEIEPEPKAEQTDHKETNQTAEVEQKKEAKEEEGKEEEDAKEASSGGEDPNEPKQQ